MRTVILGKKIENHYEVNMKLKEIQDENGKLKKVYTDKPILIKTPQLTEWVEICSYDGEPRYNSKETIFASIYIKNEINISEDESVMIDREIFRADLNEMHLRTDKVVEEIDIDEVESRINLYEHIRAFNEMMITSNEKMKAYCDIHKLSYVDTDAIELFDIVFPNEQYEIVDGVMRVKERKQEIYLSSVDYGINSISTSLNSYSFSNGSTITAIE